MVKNILLSEIEPLREEKVHIAKKFKQNMAIYTELL